MVALTTAEVWTAIESRLFAVVGFVTSRGEARTVGIVYTVRERKLFFSTDTEAWKTRHLRANPSISVTVTVDRGIPFMPWVKIPPATVTFSGTARVLALTDVPADIPDTLLDKLEPKEELRARASIVEVTPSGDFLTYGVGASLRQMLRPAEAGGRVSVG